MTFQVRRRGEKLGDGGRVVADDAAHFVDVAGVQGVLQVAVRRVSAVLRSDASAVARFAARESVLAPRLSAVSFSDPARVSVSAPTFCKLSASDASSPFSWSL